MDSFSVIVWAILGALVSAFLLYVVIRLAVTHAIRATSTPKVRPSVEEPDRSPTWWEKPPAS